MYKEQNTICGITWHNEISRITKKGVIIKEFGCLKECKMDHSHLHLTSAHKPALMPALWRTNFRAALLSCCWVIDDHSWWQNIFLCLKLRIVLIAGLSPQIWRSRREGRKPLCMTSAIGCTVSLTTFKANYIAAELMSAEHWVKFRCKG